MQNSSQKQEFYEIYDYYSQPLLERPVVQYSLSAIATIIIVGAVFLYVYLKRRKRPMMPCEQALKLLADLKLDKCVSKNDFKVFYFKLTEIFKKYLEKRYGWKVENKTDEELVALLEKQNFNKELLEQVQKILAGALWIKFANQDALKIQAQADLKTIISIVEQTKQVGKK